MIDHVSLGSRDPARAVPFYTRCFATLGYELTHQDPHQTIWGRDGHWSFCIYPVSDDAPLVGARTHVAFSAPSDSAALAFHEEAVAQGAETIRAPGPRPDIDARYYGTVLKDLEGHTIEVVYWRPSMP